MNDTVSTLSVFLLTCSLAVGSLLAIYLLVDKHHKARLAKDYAEIEARAGKDPRRTPALAAPLQAVTLGGLSLLRSRDKMGRGN